MKAALPEPEIVTKDVAWLKKARRKKLHYRPLEDVLADLSKS